MSAESLYQKSGPQTSPEFLRRLCPVCGGANKKTLYRQEFSGLSQGSFLHSYDVCVCGQCGMGYADGLPDASEFDRYYAEMSQWEFQDNQGIESPQDTERFKKIASYFSKNELAAESPILDIGCATGGLLAAFKARGFQSLSGLDPSLKCSELAGKNYGIQVKTGTVKDLPDLQGPFGLVTLSGVLEHLYDPATAIADIRSLLSDEGLFYVNVPDAEGFVDHMDGPYQQFSIEHILFFTTASLVNLMKINGFEPVRLIRGAVPYTRTYQYPVIEGIFKKMLPAAWEKEVSTKAALQEYIRVSEKVAKIIEQQLERLAKSGDPVLVWGVGTNTQRLMASSPLKRANIVAFVDSNIHYHGKEVEGRPILSPQEIKSGLHPILIASFIFREEIEHQIREKLGYDNQLLFLGED